jgi:hypothetical protein
MGFTFARLYQTEKRRGDHMLKSKLVPYLLWLIFILICICGGELAYGQDEVVQTPQVEAQILKLHDHTNTGSDKTEWSFVIQRDGTPSALYSSHDYSKNVLTVKIDNDLAIVHSHPTATSPQPSQGDIDTAKKCRMPNYEVSLYAIWVAEPSGKVRKAAEIEFGKHGRVIIHWRPL